MIMDKPKHNQHRNTDRKKYCRDCGVLITRELRVRTGENYIQAFCKPCRTIRSRIISRKRLERIKANPLW